MNKIAWIGIALCVILSMAYHVNHSPADNDELVRAIRNLTSEISTLNSRIGKWNKVGTLTSEIDDLGKDITSLESAVSSLESTIRRQ